MKAMVIILGFVLSQFQPVLHGQTIYKGTADLLKKTRIIEFTSGSATDSIKIQIQKNTIVFQDQAQDQVIIRKIKKGYEIVKSNPETCDTIKLSTMRAAAELPNSNNLRITSEKYNELKICDSQGDLIVEASSVQKGKRLFLTIEISGDLYRKEMISFAANYLITQNKIRNSPNPAIYNY